MSTSTISGDADRPNTALAAAVDEALTMLAAIAEMERDLLVERTQCGLACAQAEGKTLGQPTRTTPEQRAAIAKPHKAGESISALARGARPRAREADRDAGGLRHREDLLGSIRGATMALGFPANSAISAPAFR